MTPAERLDRAGELLDQAIAEIEDASEDVPAFSLGAMRFLKADLRVSLRRIQNVRKVLGSSSTPAG